MKFRTIKYFLKEGFKSIFKNRLMTVASFMTISVCLLIVSISYCITDNIYAMLESIEETIGITVFVEDNLTYEELEDIGQEIYHIKHVDKDSLIYISPQKALENFAETMEDGAEILEGLKEDNPLPPSFEFKIENIQYQEEILEKLEEIKGITKVNHAQGTVNILLNINNMIKYASLVLIAILAIIGIFIMSNTIKLTVYIRRVEINIMKYIGATDWFIKWPFIIEGVIIGIIGAIIPNIIIFLSYNFFIQLIYEKFDLLKDIFVFRDVYYIMSDLLPINLGIGIAIGFLGSSISTKRHLKV